MRKFSVRPTLTLKGRKFKGLRGFAGKPFHPPLTDFPVVAFVFAAAFDVISAVGGRDHDYAYGFWHAGAYMLVGGLVVAVLAALTGFFDWLRSSKAGTQARRTANTHATIMMTVTALALVDTVLHLTGYHTHSYAPAPAVALSVVVALLVSWGATYGGSLVFDYGFNVETAADSAVWHESETDVFPGDEH